MTKPQQEQSVLIHYTNWRGETADRIIIPITLWFGETEWHPGKQWLIKAYDIQKDAERDFAVKDIKSWSTP